MPHTDHTDYTDLIIEAHTGLTQHIFRYLRCSHLQYA
jgi:hypothetical protein